jgi:PAS domain S-box-containing protein
MLDALILISPDGAITILASLCSGAIGGSVAFWQARKIAPAQKKELEATAQKAAVDIVETALKVAQDRIASLEQQIEELIARTAELRDSVQVSTAERTRLQGSLNLALAQRAELQQQLVDLSRIIGERRVDYLMAPRPSDAILIVNLDGAGRIDYVNDGVFGLLGYAPMELIDRGVALIVPQELRAAHMEHRSMYNQDPHERKMGNGLPLYARRRDGARIPVDISLHPTGDGRVIVLLKRRVEATTIENDAGHGHPAPEPGTARASTSGPGA